MKFGPKIVTDGLVLALDAANPNSYPGSGTAWNDLTPNKNNGTLVNGPTFDSANGGSIVFDGVNDYLNIPLSTTIINSFTWEFIFKKVSGNIFLIMTRNSNAGVWMSISSTDDVTFTIGGVADYSYNTNFIENEIYTLTNVINNNIWVSYINGLLVNQTTISTSRTQSGTRLVSSVILNTNNTLRTFLQQTMYSYRYYNRALSSSEILQNYNALKDRFI